MADYRIFETSAFLKELASLAPSEQARLAAKLSSYVYPLIRRAPRGHPQARLLRGYHPETWRWRIGDWRVFYQIDDAKSLVLIVALAPRKDAYR